jgi:CRP-like cAMP-binding protein
MTDGGKALERMLTLRSLPAFKGLAEADLASVAAQAQERSVASGTVLLREGDRMSRTVVVVEGRVRIERDGAVVARSERRVGVGILGMVADVRAASTVVADTASRLLVLERDRVLDLMEDDFAVLAHVLRFIAEEIISTYQRLDVDYQAPEKFWAIPAHLQVEGRDLDLVERILAIRQVPAFGRSSLDSVARYARLLEEVHLPEGAVLWREGEPCRTYLHVVQGELRGVRDKGRGVLRYGPPSMPGLFGVLSGRERRWYTAIAKTPIVALQVDRELILDLLEDDYEMAAFCLKLSARRLIRFLALRDEPATT